MSTRNYELGLPNIGGRLITAAIVLSAAMAGPAMAQSIHGTATYRERPQGHGTTVAIVLRRAGAGPSAPPGFPAPGTSPQPRSSRPLEKTYWKATER